MDEALTKSVVHLATLAILLIGLLFILVFTGVVGCNIVPGGCDIYYSLVKGGSPNVLIAHSGEGMGDYEKLYSLFNNRDIVNTQVKVMAISRLSTGNINDYDLIIVTDARKICSSKLKLFQEYYNRGGRLVWTGDAGTELCENDSLLLESERIEGGASIPIGPWARKDAGKQVSFDEFLGVNYKGNHCEFTTCAVGEKTGNIEHTDSEHKFTYGLSNSIPFSGDFGVVKINKSSNARLVAILEYGSSLVAEPKEVPWLVDGKYSFGNELPFIVSNLVGERVVYYATPLESFLEQEQKYKAIVEQMYYGMLYN